MAPPTAGSRAGAAGHTGRLGFLDGLRGLAALQVVAQHYVVAFLPGVALADPGAFHAAWEALLAFTPLRLLFDGTFAVCLFFLLSGIVLTLSFERSPTDLAGNALRRLVRLWIPIVAAGVLAFVLMGAMPHAHDEAAALSGSRDWLGADNPNPLTLTLLLREVGVDSMLAGTRDNTLFPALNDWLRPLGSLLNPPVWSLHVELYGSLLVLALVRIKAASARLHAAAVAVSGVLLMPHPLTLFVIGHLSARLLQIGAGRVGARPPAPSAMSIPMIAAGILLSAMPPVRWLHGIAAMLAGQAVMALPHIYQAFTLQRMLGAILVFAGVLVGEHVQTVLGARPLRRLGQLSFGIYLVHFPILFTLASLGLTALRPHMSYTACLLAVTAGGVAVTVAAAMLFERWVDRPATALSRRIGFCARQAPIRAQAAVFQGPNAISL